MRSLQQYIYDALHTQINPDLCRDILDIRPPKDKQSITSSNDIIHVEFYYKDSLHKYDIRYDEIEFGTSENTYWFVDKIEDNIRFHIKAQKSGTGRYNCTIIDMTINVYDIKSNKELDTVEPKCYIKSYDENSDVLNIDVHNI